MLDASRLLREAARIEKVRAAILSAHHERELADAKAHTAELVRVAALLYAAAQAVDGPTLTAVASVAG